VVCIPDTIVQDYSILYQVGLVACIPDTIVQDYSILYQAGLVVCIPDTIVQDYSILYQVGRVVCIPDTIEVANGTHVLRQFLRLRPLEVVYDRNDVAVGLQSCHNLLQSKQ
jgi:hypothetical protein